MADPGAGLDPSGISAIATGAIGLVQTGIGLLDKAAARRRQNALFKKRTTYKTPQELWDILHAGQNRAMSGYDPATLSFLTNQISGGFSGTLGAAQRLGADPNSLSAGYDQYMNSIMKVGAENHAANMENFSKFLGAKSMIADSKTAEWQSKENLLRDQLQAEGVNFQNANANAQSGLNAVIGAGASLAEMQLFKDGMTPEELLRRRTAKGVANTDRRLGFGPTTAGSLLDNGLPMGG